ncbi:MAG: polyhydroxyalkanoic acid system family protein [Deltaproteobacteria bacterium]|nr:polyhydroxyalkanoic acid system family protein [Deltaproteobacteria bacterium]
MSDINITKPHALGLETAKSKLDAFSTTLEKEYGIKSSWNGNTCDLKGTGLKKGTVTVSENDITIDITLGLLGKALKGTIESKIESQFSKVLG